MISDLEIKKLAESLVIVAPDRFKTAGDASNWIKDQLDLPQSSNRVRHALWTRLEQWGIGVKMLDGVLWYVPIQTNGEYDESMAGVVETFEGQGFASYCLDNFSLDFDQLREAYKKVYLQS